MLMEHFGQKEDLLLGNTGKEGFLSYRGAISAFACFSRHLFRMARNQSPIRRGKSLRNATQIACLPLDSPV